MNDHPPHPAALPVDELMKDCELRRTRRGGPGGQHRNKVETAVEIVHRPTQVAAEASERRSQEQNRKVAIWRLRLHLALAIRRAAVGETSELWRSRVRDKKVAVAADHADFPAILAEALDAAMHFDQVQDAAEHLTISVSQLTKLLKREPSALQQLNRKRKEFGLRPLV